MKYRNHAIVLGIAAAAFAAGRWAPTFEPLAQAQPDKKQPAAPAGQPAMSMPQPGPEHKMLDVLVGDFQGSVKMWMAAGETPMENKGTIHREWVLDGRFVHEEVNGDAMGPGGPAFHGLGVTGYNTVEKRYETGWIDNSVTWLTTTTGTYDAAKKTFTFTGDCIDPAQNKRVKSRSTLDCSNPDHEVMTAWSIGADGKEFKCFEGTFDRVKK